MKDDGGQADDCEVEVRVCHETFSAVSDEMATTADPPRGHSLPKGDGAIRAAEMRAVREALAGWRWI